jgi:hypothetical protein
LQEHRPAVRRPDSAKVLVLTPATRSSESIRGALPSCRAFTCSADDRWRPRECACRAFTRRHGRCDSDAPMSGPRPVAPRRVARVRGLDGAGSSRGTTATANATRRHVPCAEPVHMLVSWTGRSTRIQGPLAPQCLSLRCRQEPPARSEPASTWWTRKHITWPPFPVPERAIEVVVYPAHWQRRPARRATHSIRST